ncbi:MAG: dihydrolipoamide acetyltransferase family protein [Armatimonadaceae bacterium]
MADVIMPKLGDAMEEGKIVRWLKNVGDSVKSDDPIFEVETDKTNVEVGADISGVLEWIGYAAGVSVSVGKPIARIGDGSNVNKTIPKAATAPVAASAPAVVAAPAEPVAQATTVQSPVATAVASDGSWKPFGDSLACALPEGLGGSASLSGEPVVLELAADTSHIKASPLARAIAAANHVSLSSIQSAGPIKAADVEALIAGASVSTTSASPVNAVEVQEYNAMRRTIAKRLTESKQQVPHIYVTVEVDMEALLTVREQLNRNAGGEIPKVSVNDLIVKASACALIEVPVVNSKFDNNQRIISKSAHIGVAVSLPDGLIVPVVKNADALSVRNISRTVKQLAEKARSGKLVPSEYSGGTFTISNMGAIADVENFAAIINPGEGAILAVSGTRTVPAVVDGAIVARRRMKVTLSADHRVVDGSDAAMFLGAFKRVMENPVELLA